MGAMGRETRYKKEYIKPNSSERIATVDNEVKRKAITPKISQNFLTVLKLILVILFLKFIPMRPTLRNVTAI